MAAQFLVMAFTLRVETTWTYISLELRQGLLQRW